MNRKLFKLLFISALQVSGFANAQALTYKEEEITFKNNDVELSGTLTIPLTNGRHPAIVMITGSGPQNRDEEVVGFKPFKLIAEHLSQQGYAVLRYDDRGFGKSAGKKVFESTLQELAQDALQAVDYLQTRSDINPNEIGLLGHSEGACLAPYIYTLQQNISFLILLAGPDGVAGEDALIEQQRLIGKSSGLTGQQISDGVNYYKKIFSLIKNNAGNNELESEIRKSAIERYTKLSNEERETVPDSNAFVQSIVKRDLKLLGTTWFKSTIDFNAVTYLPKVKCPVLILFGENDLQVSYKQNHANMLMALKNAGNDNVTSKIFPKANHLFMKSETGSPLEYAQLKKEFVPGLLPTISTWLQTNIR